MDLVRTPIEWELTYPVYPTAPIGTIRLEGHAYAAWLYDDDLGDYLTGDEAAEAIWARFIEASASRHAAAAVTHGARERHASQQR